MYVELSVRLSTCDQAPQALVSCGLVVHHTLHYNPIKFKVKNAYHTSATLQSAMGKRRKTGES